MIKVCKIHLCHIHENSNALFTHTHTHTHSDGTKWEKCDVYQLFEIKIAHIKCVEMYKKNTDKE